MATNGRAPDLHKELKRVLKDHLRRIPGVCVHGPEPFPDRFFNLNQDRINIDQIDNVVRRNGGIHEGGEDPQGVVVEHPDAVIQCRDIAADERERKRADIRITTTFLGEEQTDILLDHTISSIHVPSNHLAATTRYGVTDKAEKTKKGAYSIWDHQGQIIGLACDSNGTIGKSAMKFFNRMYSKWNVDRTQERRWESEVHRVQLKKRFLDSLSLVFAKAQLKDILLLGQFRLAVMFRRIPDIHAQRLAGIFVNNRGRASLPR